MTYQQQSNFLLLHIFIPYTVTPFTTIHPAIITLLSNIMCISLTFFVFKRKTKMKMFLSKEKENQVKVKRKIENVDVHALARNAGHAK